MKTKIAMEDEKNKEAIENEYKGIIRELVNP